jgi:hypothetical protein
VNRCRGITIDGTGTYAKAQRLITSNFTNTKSGARLRTRYPADSSCENDRYRRNPQFGARKFRRKNVGPTIQDSSLSQERGGPAPTPLGAPERLTVRFCSNDCGTPKERADTTELEVRLALLDGLDGVEHMSKLR